MAPCRSAISRASCGSIWLWLGVDFFWRSASCRRTLTPTSISRLGRRRFRAERATKDATLREGLRSFCLVKRATSLSQRSVAARSTSNSLACRTHENSLTARIACSASACEHCLRNTLFCQSRTLRRSSLLSAGLNVRAPFRGGCKVSGVDRPSLIDTRRRGSGKLILAKPCFPAI
jgi:hypothetical protein